VFIEKAYSSNSVPSELNMSAIINVFVMCLIF
jgi:hypothetical protein